MKINELPTPCFVIDETKLIHNLELLKEVEKRTGAKILLAQKCFSCFEEYPLIGKYISGTTASGLYEARLGKEEMGLENHVYSPVYRSQDIEELAEICDHIVFNSKAQLKKYAEVVKVHLLVYVLIQNVQHRLDMQFMIHVCLVLEWEFVHVILMMRLQKWWMDFISILYVNRILMI